MTGRNPRQACEENPGAGFQKREWAWGSPFPPSSWPPPSDWVGTQEPARSSWYHVCVMGRSPHSINPKPRAGKSTPHFPTTLSRVHWNMFSSAPNKLHLVRTEDEIQKNKRHFCREPTSEMSQTQQYTRTGKMGNEARDGRGPRQNSPATEGTWSKRTGPPFLWPIPPTPLKYRHF